MSRPRHDRVIACAFLPRLPRTVLAKDQERDDDEDMAIESGTVLVVRPRDKPDWVLRGVMRIVDCSDDLRARGVLPPMRILDAQVHEPALDVAIVREERIEAELLSLAELCLSAAPLVEPEERFLYLDLTGIPRPVPTQLRHIAGLLEQAGHECAVAASPGKRLSRALALAAHRYQRSGRDRTLYVPADRQREAIGRLPLEVAGLSPDLSEALLELGLQTLSDVAGLSKSRLAPRLYKEAKAVFDLLSAHDQMPVKGIRPPPEIAEVRDFDFGVLRLESLLFALLPLCERVCRRVGARGERLLGVRLELLVLPIQESEDADVETADKNVQVCELMFPEPLDDPRALLDALRLRLERTGLSGEVHRLVLRAGPASRVAGVQSPLFADVEAAAEQAPETLRSLLAELMAELGPERVGSPYPRPHMLPERMTGLGWPPKDDDGPGHFRSGWSWPVRFVTAPERVHPGAVKSAVPFFRLAGEDDRDRPVERDYRVVLTSDGRRALCVWDTEAEELTVHAWFD